MIAAARLRGGTANSARGAASLAAEAISAARQAGCTGQIVFRIDSAYYSAAVLGAIRAAGARFSVTVRMDPKIRAAIAGIGEDAWTPITYPRAVWDEDQNRLISDAEVAEVRYMAFAAKKGKAITARLIVRRVKDLNRKAAEGQDELFTIWRYHALFTDSPFEMIQAEAHHRDHAIVEQVFADLTSGPLAHLPSGHFPANAAWLALAAICHNLTRAGRLPGRRLVRQSPRRDHPRPADRRRCPHRASRPRPYHRAPARRLAPPDRMDEPVRSRLRPARRRGLTSPDPVTAPARPPRPPVPVPQPNTRTSRRTRPAAGKPCSRRSVCCWEPADQRACPPGSAARIAGSCPA